MEEDENEADYNPTSPLNPYHHCTQTSPHVTTAPTHHPTSTLHPLSPHPSSHITTAPTHHHCTHPHHHCFTHHHCTPHYHYTPTSPLNPPIIPHHHCTHPHHHCTHITTAPTHHPTSPLHPTSPKHPTSSLLPGTHITHISTELPHH